MGYSYQDLSVCHSVQTDRCTTWRTFLQYLYIFIQASIVKLKRFKSWYCAQQQYHITVSCLNQIPLGPTLVLGIDRCLVSHIGTLFNLCSTVSVLLKIRVRQDSL